MCFIFDNLIDIQRNFNNKNNANKSGGKQAQAFENENVLDVMIFVPEGLVAMVIGANGR